MPIPKHLRHFYSAAAGWPATRAAILVRAGGQLNKRGCYIGGARCEACGKPDRERVWTATWREPRPHMAWSPKGIVPAWRDQDGQACLRPAPKEVREILVVLTVGHLNHVSGDDRPENMRAWCQWCHLNHDLAHHHETRSARKDARRPLLEAAS